MSSSPIIDQMQQAGSAATNGTKDRISSDKSMFLKLLMAQMTNQDPLNPVEDKEFISQMAQFTSVEQLMNINESMEGVSQTLVKQQLSTAASIIGSQVYAKGTDISVWHDPDGKEDSVIGSLYATIPQEVSSLTMNVHRTDADGKSVGIVWSKNIGAMAAGQINAKDFFNGTDANGNKLTNGAYSVSFSALDKNGKNVLIETNSAGIVVGMTTREDGNHLMTLDGGRQVYLNNVEIVEMVIPTGGNNTDNDDNKKPEEGEDPKTPESPETPEAPETSETP